jgi:hypothetical protein
MSKKNFQAASTSLVKGTYIFAKRPAIELGCSTLRQRRVVALQMGPLGVSCDCIGT